MQRNYAFSAPLWLQSLFGKVSKTIQYYLLTTDGNKFVEERSRFITQILEEEKESGYAIKPIDYFNTSHMVAINPNRLTDKALQKLTSGDLNEPNIRSSYLTFTQIIGLTGNEELAWPMRQDTHAFESRNIQLKPFMAPKNLTGTIKILLDKKINDNQMEIPCLYQWVHQLVIEAISETILGMPNIPPALHAMLDKMEWNVVNSSTPFKLFNIEFALSQSQIFYQKVKQECSKVASQFLLANKNIILQNEENQRYIYHILKMLADEKNIKNLEAAFDDPEIQEKLAGTAIGLHFAAGTLSTALTLAILHLKDLRNFLQDEKMDLNEEVLAYYFREVARWAASAAHNVRYVSNSLTLDLKNGEKLAIPENSYIFINLRAALHDPNVWGENGKKLNSEQFKKSERAPMLGNSMFPLFSTGMRSCPGQSVAQNIAKKVLGYFMDNKISLDIKNQETADAENDFWTNTDFVTRPTGMIPVTLHCQDVRPKLSVP